MLKARLAASLGELRHEEARLDQPEDSFQIFDEHGTEVFYLQSQKRQCLWLRPRKATHTVPLFVWHGRNPCKEDWLVDISVSEGLTTRELKAQLDLQLRDVPTAAAYFGLHFEHAASKAKGESSSSSRLRLREVQQAVLLDEQRVVDGLCGRRFSPHTSLAVSLLHHGERRKATSLQNVLVVRWWRPCRFELDAGWGWREIVVEGERPLPLTWTARLPLVGTEREREGG